MRPDLSITQKPCPRATHWHGWLLLAGIMPALLGGIAEAATRILLVTSNNGPLYTEFADSFSQQMAGPGEIEILRMTVDDPALSTTATDAALTIAVGVAATEKIITLDIRRPVISTLIPRITAEALKTEVTADTPFVVLYLDQPPERQLRLIRLVLPNAQRIGVPLGPFSSQQATSFLAPAAELHFDLLLAQVTTDPVTAFVDMLPDCDLVLALPDTTVYNGSTVRPILLSTFRAETPVFGYSAAFVDAGALAGVYSSPGQIGQQAAEMAAKVLAGQRVAAIHYPRYFTVRVNEQIAGVLRIEVPDAEKLHAQLLAGER